MILKNIQTLSINTIRTLSIDAIQKANSGHPGAAMSLSPAMYYLWQNFLIFNPLNHTWVNRDRYILSNGHASMLLYSILFLTNISNKHKSNLQHLSTSLHDIKNFRQINSKCPGHPEYKHTCGIECTTGPLAQGIATSVGIGIAQQWMKSYFNKNNMHIINFNIYVFCGDGCLMEGLSHEAASLAGHFQLYNLCWIYDCNNITIEGKTDITYSDNIKQRFKSYNWNVYTINNINNLTLIHKAYMNFIKNKNKPTLIIVNNKIGFGSPNKENTSNAHGSPLGKIETLLTKTNYNWPKYNTFTIPKEVITHFKNGFYKRGIHQQSVWNNMFKKYKYHYPKLSKHLQLINNNILPDNWHKNITSFNIKTQHMSTREASGYILNQLSQNIPWLIGGSADLSPSTKTILTYKNAQNFSKDNQSGKNLCFGIRENSMSSILNGLSLCNMKSYGSTFLTFMDYLKPGLRLSCIMKLDPIYIFTHDSISVGEDGPTHQPIEHLSHLRSIPNLITFRPADANEVIACWKIMIQLTSNPHALILSRQSLPIIKIKNLNNTNNIICGAYILCDPINNTEPDIIFISTGSEIHLCIQAYHILSQQNINIRIVNIISFELFNKQSEKYKNYILPKHITKRIIIEQASIFGWHQYYTQHSISITINNFGKSATMKQLQKFYNFNIKHIINIAKKQMHINNT